MTLSPATSIAEFILEIEKGRFKPLGNMSCAKVALEQVLLGKDTIIDATTIYEYLLRSNKSERPYEDFEELTPPWNYGNIGYINQWGNTNVLTFLSLPKDAEEWNDKIIQNWKSENNDNNDVKWNDVKFIVMAMLWSGGYSINENKYINPAGPILEYDIAIYSSGKLADIRWSSYIDFPQSSIEANFRVLLHTFNFMHCTNIQLIEPTRPRIERRRIQKTGLRVQTIGVRPTRKVYKRSDIVPLDLTNTPQHSVRNHFAHYGPKYNRGLLFGKYEGRFYIPQHIRGKEEYGKTEKRYVIKHG